MASAKTNIVIGTLSGILVGFVLGTAFSAPSGSLKADGVKAAGDVSGAVTFDRWNLNEEESCERRESADTLKVKAVDNDGKDIEIMIVR